MSDFGCLPSGSRYAIEVPKDWNGTLLLWSRPVPVAPEQPPWPAGSPTIGSLLKDGYAVAGSANTIFWPVELAFSDQPALLEAARRIIGAPQTTIAMGFSIGGIISAGRLQRFGSTLSGVMAACGNLAGAVANHNRELDVAFVAKTLLARDSALALTGITDPRANLDLSHRILDEAQGTSAGRARLALAAAVGNLPGWHDPSLAEPDHDDYDARQRNQFLWFEEVGFLVFFAARAHVENQAGGNPSWNTGVDYRVLLQTSINRDEVEVLYRSAGLDLEADLDRLASEDRIEADPDAVTYLERHIVFNGDLGGIPVLTAHTDGDGLVTPDQEHAFAEVVEYAGQKDLLRQLYIHRGGHCTFTAAETLTALDVLVQRTITGTWPDLQPEVLNEAARRRGVEANSLAPGEPAEPAFFDFNPPPFPRRYDIRDAALRRCL